MDLIEGIAELRARVQAWHRADERVALVPTMGNLHEGHLTLVREARAAATRTVVSLFVNPLQFAPGEDYAAYPRTLDEDRERLSAAGVDVLFAPTAEAMYTRAAAEQTRVSVPGLSRILCGASRPGHFDGVATVVCKLFNLVDPDIAFFGEKDLQQLMVIRRMVEDLCMRVEVRGLATVREPDGLAMSSRNAYLSEDERARAPLLYRTLCTVRDWIGEGIAIEEAEARALGELVRHGFEPDYVSVRSVRDLEPPRSDERDLVVLAAAKLGRARLIDNLRIDRVLARQ